MFHSTENDALEIAWNNSDSTDLDVLTYSQGEPGLKPLVVPPHSKSIPAPLNMTNDEVGFQFNQLPVLNLQWIDNGQDSHFVLGSPSNGWSQSENSFILVVEVLEFSYSETSDGGIVIVGILDLGDVED